MGDGVRELCVSIDEIETAVQTMQRHAITFRAPSRDDVEHIAMNLREQDKREIELSRGDEVSPATVAVASASCSQFVLVGAHKGEPICLFGIGHDPDYEEAGCVWMLASTGLDKVPKHAFMAASYVGWELMRKLYPTASNVLPAGSKRTLAWLQRLGFKRAGTLRKYGASKTKFVRFEYTNV